MDNPTPPSIFADSSEQQKLQRLLHTLDTGGIAQLLLSSPPPQRAIIWQLLDEESIPQILGTLPEEVSSQFLEDMEPDRIASILHGMEDDDLTDVLQELPDTLTDMVLRSMSNLDRQRIEVAMSYDPDTAGGWMTTSHISITPDHTLDVLIRYLRLHVSELPVNLDSILVVGRDNILLGSLSILKMASSDPQLTVREVMETDTVTSLKHDMPISEVAILFKNYDWLSAPVVDDEDRLVGRITVDDILDVMEQYVQSSPNLAGRMEGDTFTTPFKAFQHRSIWLGVNLATALMASSVIKIFEDTIQQVVALAVLMPLIASMGGIAGTQTLTLVIRGLALGQFDAVSQSWVIRRELFIGIANGVLWAIVMAIISSLWFQETTIGIIIAMAMAINMLAGAVFGLFIPLLLKRINMDPVLSSAVILTTVTDIIGFLSFLGLATIFYS